MRGIVTIGLVAIGLSSCATTDSLRDKEPVFSGATVKRADLYAGCVTEAWQNKSAGRISYSPHEDGVTLTVPANMGGLDLLLDIRKRGQMFDIKMYSRLPYGYSEFATAAKLCE